MEGLQACYILQILKFEILLDKYTLAIEQLRGDW